jgi:hypothetical protein
MPVLLRICHTFQPSFVGAASAAEPATSTSDFGAIILFTSHSLARRLLPHSRSSAAAIDHTQLQLIIKNTVVSGCHLHFLG